MKRSVRNGSIDFVSFNESDLVDSLRAVSLNIFLPQVVTFFTHLCPTPAYGFVCVCVCMFVSVPCLCMYVCTNMYMCVCQCACVWMSIYVGG